MHKYKSSKENEAGCKSLLLSTEVPKIEALIRHIEFMYVG